LVVLLLVALTVTIVPDDAGDVQPLPST
jgi:hypothetical protein